MYKVSNTKSSKRIFILLTKIIAFNNKFSIIEVKKLSFELSFLLIGKFRITGLSLVEKIHRKLCLSLEVFLDIFSKSWK